MAAVNSPGTGPSCQKTSMPRLDTMTFSHKILTRAIIPFRSRVPGSSPGRTGDPHSLTASATILPGHSIVHDNPAPGRATAKGELAQDTLAHRGSGPGARRWQRTPGSARSAGRGSPRAGRARSGRPGGNRWAGRRCSPPRRNSAPCARASTAVVLIARPLTALHVACAEVPAALGPARPRQHCVG